MSKISAISFQTISKKKSNEGKEELQENEDTVFSNHNPDLTSFIQMQNPSNLFVATEKFRFFKSKDKKIVFQRCYQNMQQQIIWHEFPKVYLVEEGVEE